MPYQIKLEKFEGPLDLLLQFIEQERLDITEVSLAKVTDQYLGYLNQTADISTEELADFLVVAAKLLLIKSKILLPQLEVDAEEASDLEQQLRIYKEFYEASKVLQKRIVKKHFLYPRERMIVRIDKVFNPPKSITSETLSKIFRGVLASLEPWVNLPREVVTKTISIRERIANIQQMIQEKMRMRFGELLRSANNKTEVIVTFLAILELVKQRSIAVVQEGIFDDIVVQKIDTTNKTIINEE